MLASSVHAYNWNNKAVHLNYAIFVNTYIIMDTFH